MKRFQFNKLIRSKIPNRMALEGVSVNKETLNTEEFINQLKHKIVEEANEVLETKTKEALTTELADVIEVIHALATAHNIDMKEVEAERLEKRSVNGHFIQDNYIHYIEVAEDNHKVIEYLENKDRHYKCEFRIREEKKLGVYRV